MQTFFSPRHRPVCFGCQHILKSAALLQISLNLFSPRSFLAFLLPFISLETSHPNYHLNSQFSNSSLKSPRYHLKMTFPHLCLSILTLAILLPPLLAQQCFYPDGSIHTDGVPCAGKGSACCTVGEVCDSNFLCNKGVEQRAYNDEVFVRHSCSDKTYKSGLCPGICLNGGFLPLPPSPSPSPSFSISSIIL